MIKNPTIEVCDKKIKMLVPAKYTRLEKLIKVNLNDVEYFFEKDLNNFERFLFIKFN